MRKHILSFVLVLILTLSAVSITAFASTEVIIPARVRESRRAFTAWAVEFAESHFTQDLREDPLFAARGARDDRFFNGRQTSRFYSGTHLMQFYAILEDDSLWGWGYNRYGNLGDGTRQDRAEPVMILDSVFSYYACWPNSRAIALRHDGTVWAWGQNSFFETRPAPGGGMWIVPHDPATDRLSPVMILDNVISLYSQFGPGSRINTTALKADGTLWWWGNDGVNRRLDPEQVLDDVVSFSAQDHVNFALRTDGSLWAFGFILGDHTQRFSSATPRMILETYVPPRRGASPYVMFIDSDGHHWAIRYEAHPQISLPDTQQPEPEPEPGPDPTPPTHISVTIDNNPVAFADQAPAIIDNRTLVPVRGVFEALGFEVGWNPDAQQVTLTRSGDTVVITVGSDIFTANGATHTLDVPAQIINNRTMLPIRAVVESVGYNVDWDAVTRTVIIETE